MTKKSVVILLVLVWLPVSVTFGLERIDVSPMVLVNLADNAGSDSRFIGGAVAGDFYFSPGFAIRGTVGYVKSLYNTSVSRIDELFTDVEPYSDPQYHWRLSVSPYAEASTIGGLRPYVTLSGGISHSDGGSSQISDIRSLPAGVISNSQYMTSNRPGGTYYDISGSVGMKVPIASQVFIFAELNHRFYSSFDTDWYRQPDGSYTRVPYGFDDYKTFLSTGLTYSFNLTK